MEMSDKVDNGHLPLATRRLTGEHYKIIGLTSLGGALEFYEFVIFILLTPYISQVFFPPSVPDWIRTLQTLAIFATGYFVRPIGGICLAVLGDLIGRKRVFAITLFLMAAATLLIGLLPTYAQVGLAAPILLLLCRVTQGVALGGEIPGAAVFVAEHVPYRRLGLACSLIGAGLSLGLLLGAGLIGFLAGRLSPPEMISHGWRIPFIVGGLLGLVAGFLRRYVRESPVFAELQMRNQLAKEMPIAVLLRSSRKELVFGALLATVTAAVVPAVYLYPPVFLQSVLKFEPTVVRSAHTTAILMNMLGTVVGGWLVDRIGALTVFATYSVGAIAAAYVMFLNVPGGPQHLQFFYAALGFFCSITAFGYYFLIQSFPPQTRFTGIAISYNISSAVFGGLTPLILAALSPSHPLATAHYVAFFSLLGLISASLLWRWRKPIGGI